MKIFVRSLAVLALLAGSAQAGIVNGDFETGDTTGYTVLPDDPLQISVEEIDGSHKLVMRLSQTTPSDQLADVDQTFTVDGASPKLFSLEFSGEFFADGPFPNDGVIRYGIVYHNVGDNTDGILASGVVQDGESLSIPTTTLTAILTPGAYTLGFSMGRANFAAPSSGTMIIDNIQLVPEPSGIALLLLGTAAILVCGRRSRR